MKARKLTEPTGRPVIRRTYVKARARVLRRFWPLIRRWRDWQLQRRAPWPIVWECYGTDKAIPHRREDGSYALTCAQCDGSHYHAWAAWEDAPLGGAGTPVRCRICGARKCDHPECTARRHHRDPHNTGEGYFEPVGSLR